MGGGILNIRRNEMEDKTKLEYWINPMIPIERTELHNGFARVYTDEAHRFFIDVLASGHFAPSPESGLFYDMVGVDLVMAYIIDRYDGPLDEFKRIMKIQ
jgi:hypothetical protein